MQQQGAEESGRGSMNPANGASVAAYNTAHSK